MLRIFLCVIFLIGLIYLIIPGPDSIADIPPLPNSIKSTEPGDTVQVKNIAAFFSDYRRGFVTDFYKNNLKNLHCCLAFFPPLRFNHPPEDAFNFIRDQQPSTYLEEFSYPLRSSLFVNGFEPFDENGKPYRKGATDILIGGEYYVSKTTLRFYTSNVYARVFVYVGIFISSILLFKLYKRAISDKL